MTHRANFCCSALFLTLHTMMVLILWCREEVGEGTYLPPTSDLTSPFSPCQSLTHLSQGAFCETILASFFLLLFSVQGCWLELPAANRPCLTSQAAAQAVRPPVPLSPRVPGRGDGLAMPACTLGAAHPGPRSCCLPRLPSPRCFAWHKSWPAGGQFRGYGFWFLCQQESSTFAHFLQVLMV